MEINIKKSSKKEVILFLVEGKKTEPKILENIEKIFFVNKTKIIKIEYGTSLYTLYSKIKNEEYLDIFAVIKKEHEDELKEISRKQVSRIYLFFDHDAHNSNASDEKIRDMLDKFSDETENGKLYISYPMIEAMKDINKDYCCQNKDCFVKKSENRSYKEKITKKIKSNNLVYKISDISKYNEEIWEKIILHNLKKTCCLITGKYKLEKYEILKEFTQKVIYEKQENNIKKFEKVMSLSAVPLFIFDNLKKEKIEIILSNDDGNEYICK